MVKLKKCPVCGGEMASSARACPKCGAKNKKPVYLRWWFIALVILVGIVGYFKIDAALKDFTVYIEQGDEIVTMKASELCEFARADSSTYSQKYFGKPVSFTAKITGTNGRTTYTNISTTYEYSLDFGDSVDGIVVGFDKPYMLSVGDTVMIEGKLSSQVYGTVYINGTHTEKVK